MRWTFVLAFAICPAWNSAVNAQTADFGRSNQQVPPRVSRGDEFEIRSLPKMLSEVTSDTTQPSAQFDSEFAEQFQNAYENLLPEPAEKPQLPIKTVGAKVVTAPLPEPPTTNEPTSISNLLGWILPAQAINKILFRRLHRQFGRCE